MGRLMWRRRLGQLDDPVHHDSLYRRRPRRTRLVVQKTFHTLPHKTLLPTPDGGLGLARRAHNRAGSLTFGG